MKSNYLNKTKAGIKALATGLFLFGASLASAQCAAHFTATVGPGGVVHFSSTSTGTTISTYYVWNFGGYGASPSYTFPTNGYKYVCLSIYSNTTAPGSCTSTVCDSVLVTTAPSSSPCAANFTSSVVSPGNLVFGSTSTGIPSGPPSQFNWSFGDGNFAGGPVVPHNFAANGVYNVCLAISNTVTGCRDTICSSITVTTAPTGTCNANFSFSYGSGGSVSFASTSTGTSVSTNYSWSYGDGGSGTGVAPSHVYASNGAKVVCLTITNSVTGCSSTKCDSVHVTNATSSVTPCSPSVMYTLSKDSVTALTWNAYPSYPAGIINATWSWGDGTTTTGLYPSHTYSAAGTYSTCVTVSVACGTITATASYCYVATIFRMSQSSDMITVNVKQNTATGIKAQSAASGLINIYPNPSNGEFVLELTSQAKENTVSIYNVMGVKVFEKSVQANVKQTIDVTNLAAGTYFVKINSEAGSINKKITIQK
jgi:PKD repeat protein